MPGARREENVSPSDGKRSRRRLPPGIVPALLRTRPVVVGEHFSVHGKSLQQRAQMPAEISATGPQFDANRFDAEAALIVAVPKRVLRRAVDRNAVRRVAREAWRAAALDRAPVVAMLRMKRVPQVAGLRERKRLVRVELDQLFATLRHRLGTR